MKKSILVISMVIVICLVMWMQRWQRDPLHDEESLTEQETLTEQELINLTFEAARDLNQKSNLGEYGLLEPQPYPMTYPGSGYMNGGEDSFNCFRYDGDVYITGLFLRSEGVNVFGISIGQKLEEVNEILYDEGYLRHSVEDIQGMERFGYPSRTVVIYVKHQIYLNFSLVPDTGVIFEIGVVVPSPDEAVTF